MDSKKVEAFLDEVWVVCRKHQMAILPEEDTYAGLDVVPMTGSDEECRAYEYTILGARFVDDEAPETTGDTTRESVPESLDRMRRLK